MNGADPFFNLENYRALLQGALESRYQFRDFSEKDSPSPVCLLRHDIDADLNAALEMAKVEAELGIKATYFLMTRSPLYNLLSRHSSRCVEAIKGLGHAIALHFDQGFMISSSRIANQIDFEAEMLERLFDVEVTVISFHQPNESVLQGAVDTGRRLNTYNKHQFNGFEYYSDSNRVFPLREKGTRAKEIFSALAPKNIQLLIHPIWWVYNESSTPEVWNRAIRSNFQNMQEQLLATERAFGTKRTFRVEGV